MKKRYILGNWKANKTIDEAREWIDSYIAAEPPKISETDVVIVCPAFHHIPLFSKKTPYYTLGAQDISQFANGAYTGEVTGTMMKELLEYVMVGHSERRKHFEETDEVVAEKVKQAVLNGMRPVVCVSEVGQVSILKEHIADFETTGLLLYEPLFAIGTGASDTPENANKTAEAIHGVMPNVPILYGGSVTPDNVLGFMKEQHLSGVGVGGASLDAKKFSELVRIAVSS